MKVYDTIILGAGIAGLSLARELAKRNQKVLLLEREEKGGKASRAAAGILDPYTEVEDESPLFRLGLKALEEYPSFLEELGERATSQVEFERLGVLYLALTSEDETLLKDRYEWQRRRGLATEWFSGEKILSQEPTVSSQVRGGIYYPEIPKVNPEKLTQLLWEVNKEMGVEMHTSIERPCPWIEQEKVRGVKMLGVTMESPTVILATGCWSELRPLLGVTLDVRPVRGQILLLRPPPTSRRPQHILHTLRWAYIVPWSGDRLLIGSTLELEAGFDDRVTAGGKEDILKRVSEMVEDIRSFPIEASWSGLRPYAEGGLPLVGRTPVQGLFLATGYYRSGILIAPLVGKLLAEGMISGNFSPLLEPCYAR